MNFMNNNAHFQYLLIATSVFIGCFATILPAQALSWSRTEDPWNDSYAGDGSNDYETYGMGYALSGDYLLLAIDSELGVSGRAIPEGFVSGSLGRFPVPDYNIGWGEIFINPASNQTFQAGFDSGTMQAIKFALNDSPVTETGVFNGVSGTYVYQENGGFRNIASFEFLTGINQKLGNFESDDPYYRSLTGYGVDTPTVIGSGTRLETDIAILTRQELADLGFATTGGGSFGIKVERRFLPIGDFVATLFQECLNEGIAMNITNPEIEPPDSVPTPAAILPTLFGLASAALRKKKKEASVFEEIA